MTVLADKPAGVRRNVGLFCAIYHSPRVAILDEKL
jgi:ABC-type multidrug transport system ATPase subunit